MKYIVKETRAAWVTWAYTVEADSPEDAIEKAENGEAALMPDQTEIGDTLDMAGVGDAEWEAEETARR